MKTTEKEKEFEQSLEDAAWNYVHKSDSGDPHFAFIGGAKWVKKYIFDWLEQKDLLTDDKSTIKEELEKKL